MNILVVIPAYNHPATIRAVAQDVVSRGYRLLVVDDGSDVPVEPLLDGVGADVIRFDENQGKGAAILEAARFASDNGYAHMITLDADGQHDPADIPAVVREVEKHPESIIVGVRDFEGATGREHIPSSSKFGRKFSNFWIRVQTGARLEDSQSGFRAYPVAVLTGLKFREKRYAFEIEVLAKASWAGFGLRNVPVSVMYPPKDERVSHFKKLKDNVQISLLNSRLTARSFLPVPHRKYDLDNKRGKVSPIHPLRSLRMLLEMDATPRELGISCAIGMLLGTLPLIGLHSLSIVLVCGWWRLNKIAGLGVSQLCMPPFVPALCVEMGYYMRHGEFLTEISLKTLGYEAPQRLWEWVLGSLVLAPAFTLIVGGLAWGMSAGIRAQMLRKGALKEGEANERA